MKFICEKKILLKIVNSTDMIVRSKMSFANFANLLIETKEDKITISATNGDLSQIASVPAEVETPGEIALSQARLMSILRQIPEGKIVFQVDEQKLVEIKPVNSERKVDTKLLGLSSEDFPKVEEYPTTAKSIHLDKSYFKKMIQKVSFAVATHATRYALNGILLELKENKINLVASDSRRLAVFNTLVPDLGKQEERIILLPELLTHLQRQFILDGNLSFCYQEGKIYFQFDEFMINSNLMNGEYPNYDMFLPKEHTYSIGCSTSDLGKAISLATALMEGDPTHKIVFSLDKGELEVSSQVDDYGEAKEKLSVSYEKEPQKIGLNAKMITEILKQIQTEDVDFFFNSNVSPIVVKERNRNEYIYVIMPIKLGEDL